MADPSPSPNVSQPAPRPAARFAFLDGLRAIGALGVASYHIERYEPLAASARTVVPQWLQTIPQHGWMGVQVFFVISGFIIAHSLRNVRIDWKSGPLFVLRRYLRLSPPYWLTIVFVTALTVFAVKVLDDGTLGGIPSASAYLSHLVYFQEIVGHENISTGFWMLCIEMQFYALYAALLWTAQRLSGGGTVPKAWPMILCCWLPGIVLVYCYHPNPFVEELMPDVEHSVWAPYFFGIIAFGIVTYAALEGWMPAWTFWTYAGMMAARLVLETAKYQTFSKEVCVGLMAGLAIFACTKANAMHRWLNFRWLQHVGRISYSLFLIHYGVSWIVKTVGSRITGEDPWAAVGWLVLSLGVSLLAAHYLCLGVEEPSARFARSFGERRSEPARNRNPEMTEAAAR